MCGRRMTAAFRPLGGYCADWHILTQSGRLRELSRQPIYDAELTPTSGGLDSMLLHHPLVRSTGFVSIVILTALCVTPLVHAADDAACTRCEWLDSTLPNQWEPSRLDKRVAYDLGRLLLQVAPITSECEAAALGLIRYAAEHRLLAAAVWMGNYYRGIHATLYNQTITEEDLAQATAWYEEAFKLGDLEAALDLAQLNDHYPLEDEGNDFDYGIAIAYYQYALRSDQTTVRGDAAQALARIYRELGEMDTALLHYREAAKLGSGSAQAVLASEKIYGTASTNFEAEMRVWRYVYCTNLLTYRDLAELPSECEKFNIDVDQGMLAKLLTENPLSRLYAHSLLITTD